MRKIQLKNCHLYVIIDSLALGSKNIIQLTKEIIVGGADIIQLRCKDLSTKEFINLGNSIRRITSKYSVPLIINDRVDVAKAINADGVHLGQDDLPTNYARVFLGNCKIIGLSTHTLQQALDAQAKKVDYISVGPIFKTPTKPEYKMVGLSLIEAVSERIKIPYFVIGGINAENLDSVLKKSAERVAVVRSVLKAQSPLKATRKLKEKIERYDVSRTN